MPFVRLVPLALLLPFFQLAASLEKIEAVDAGEARDTLPWRWLSLLRSPSLAAAVSNPAVAAAGTFDFLCPPETSPSPSVLSLSLT
ncbi:unnamed protein product [Ectocarpus sp. 12 AP-2014]